MIADRPTRSPRRLVPWVVGALTCLGPADDEALVDRLGRHLARAGLRASPSSIRAARLAAQRRGLVEPIGFRVSSYGRPARVFRVRAKRSGGDA